ncbi:MAG TPA: amidohydrolase [Polyangiaceae bacterium]|nr:amidohydrolase [Polyangiaceae bacterium]
MGLARTVLDSQVDAHATRLIELAKKIHENPELRFAEHRASAWLAEAAQSPGVSVERGIGGLPTAFRARVGSGQGPKIAILAEYDALPEIGHACGHNLIAAGALGAFLAVCAVGGEIHGTVELIGTPAEEGGGGKIALLNAGVFDGVDAAMMFHPFDRDLLAHIALASRWIEMSFEGAPSHAALAPWDGKSALTACMETFRLIDGQRVHMRDGVRVHGYIIDGGQAVNIIPEHAKAEFSVRARDDAELARVCGIVERCARGAALACNVEMTLRERHGYRHMNNNLTLARRFGQHLASLGRSPRESDDSVGAGSTDMGDISQVLPAIHPWLQICDTGETTCHQHAFAACAVSRRGFDTMLVAAKAMARTTFDILEDAALREAAKAEFRANG